MSAREQLEALLKEATGMDVAALGSAAIERAIGRRLAACELADAGLYWEHVQGSDRELQQLIEEVVVPETWFFRDREAFGLLARYAVEEWLPAHHRGMLRVLSVPCSTGEEPYSMAMALLDAGFPSFRLGIDAVDISSRLLDHARRALYGRASFRGDQLGFRDRHFTPHGASYQLADVVRRLVSWHRANLLDPEALAVLGRYDVVFSRNVLIYFDRFTQDRALAGLAGVVRLGGLLFVGPAETGLPSRQQFVSARVPRTFAFRRQNAVTTALGAVPAAARGPRRPGRQTGARALSAASAARPARSPAQAPSAPTPPSPAAPAAPPAAAAVLAHATRLADQGRLVEAATACQEHLLHHGASAPAFYLLGLIRDSTGDHQAAEGHYRKALYLDPNHHEALLHLAFLLEQQGNPARAQALRSRARRLNDEHRMHDER